jgi:preprotein translocase subunit YajC
MLTLDLFLAQAAPGGAQQSPFFPIGMMVIVLVAMFWMTSRSQKKRDQERKKMLDDMKKGDKILFSGGIIGRVEGVQEKIVTVKIADNVKIDITRHAVNAVLGKDDDLDKAPQPA